MVFAQKHPKECFAEDLIHDDMTQNGTEKRGGDICVEYCDDCIPLSHFDSLEWIVGVMDSWSDHFDSLEWIVGVDRE